MARKKIRWMDGAAPFLCVFLVSNFILSKFSMIPCRLVLLAALLLSRDADALQVIGGSVTVVQGDTATLPCHVTDTNDDLTQITWQRRTRAKPHNDNFITIQPGNRLQFVRGHDDRFKYIGNFNNKNGTLQLSNVTLKDEGSYTCIFTLFPSGNQKTEIPLNLLVPPFTNVKDNLPTLGTEEVLFATCTAAGSRPPAEVRWLTGDLEKKVRTTTNSIQYDNGTTTTVSSLFGVPTSEINGHQVQCVISGDFLTKEISLPFTIQVYFSPTEVNIRLISEDTFECVAAANPRAKYNWSRSDQPLLESAVKVDGAKLQLLSLTSGLNGLYRCEASNAHGSKHSQLYVHVAGTCSAAWTFFGLLVSVNAIGAAVWCFSKSGYFKKRHHLVSKDSKNGTNSQREILREKLTAVESRNG
ncbi:poliovirus receptor-like isoform X1 [Oreochromis aureus]|uniref:poliovirus receptor-like isoform X1 n=1 Tax=Oreochromis aureus TaxID=47969 RepID=UPI00195497D3|nr:poliovirus receptor-like isoform X1 [Oreochromis aureus]